MSAGVLYEVNLFLDSEIEDAFKEWLPRHVKEMLKIDGFENAEIFQLEGSPLLLTVHYRVKSMKKLQTYFDTLAPQMRKDGISRFGDRFKAERRVLISKKLS